MGGRLGKRKRPAKRENQEKGKYKSLVLILLKQCKIWSSSAFSLPNYIVLLPSEECERYRFHLYAPLLAKIQRPLYRDLDVDL